MAAPVVIIGPARSGTTILFELLALDPDLRVPTAAEALHPVARRATAATPHIADPRACGIVSVPDQRRRNRRQGRLGGWCQTPQMAILRSQTSGQGPADWGKLPFNTSNLGSVAALSVGFRVVACRREDPQMPLNPG